MRVLLLSVVQICFASGWNVESVELTLTRKPLPGYGAAVHE